MKKYINQYVSEFEQELNVPLMTKEYDRPLVEYVMDSWKSLEIVKNIQILGFEYSDLESEIDINNHIFKRDKKRRKKDRYNFKFINDDRFGKLTVKIRITLLEEDPKTREKIVRQKDYTKQMLIPFQDEDGYYHIKGKRYYIIYQLTDKSTYTSSSAVTLKSLMPICVSRHGEKEYNVIPEIADKFDQTELEARDIHGAEFLLPVYNVYVFKKEVPLILFYLANGLDWTLGYLGLDNIISFHENLDNVKISDLEDNLFFQISSKCFLKINKKLFLKYPYLQGIVGMFLHVTTNRTTVADLSNKEIWTKKLSSNNTLEKGQDILVFFTRLMDETTRKNLMLDNFQKKDAYSILRWMIQNFNDLRMKDNLSIHNKRLRCNEYVASLLTKEFSKRLNKIITLGAKASMSDFQDMFKFSGSILLQKMHSSGILRFNDVINDMDFFAKFKYTNKGPNSLGGRNSNNISTRYRGIHPSYLGHIDLLVCGNADPGTSGTLSPYGSIKGLYFDESHEPDDYMYSFKNDVANIMKNENVQYIEIHADNKEDYYKIIDELTEFTDNSITISGTSKDPLNVIIEKPVELDADNTTTNKEEDSDSAIEETSTETESD